jgi:hypothetical protein
VGCWLVRSGVRAVLAILAAAAVALLTARGHAVEQRQADAQITGSVVTFGDKPLAGARVSIVSAKYAGDLNGRGAPETGQHTVTDEQGVYLLSGLPRGAHVTVFVEAEGYFTRLRTLTANYSTPVRVLLPPRDAVPDGSQYQFAGQVLRADGTPAVGAVISRSGNTWALNPKAVAANGLEELFEPWTKTDEQGKFFIVSATAAFQLNVIVDAVGAVREQRFELGRGDGDNTLRLAAGTTLRGRVLKDARPVPDVGVGLMVVAEGVTGSSRTCRAITDRDGKYTFGELPAEREYVVFTRMESLADRHLASIRQYGRTPRDGGTADAAELNLHPAHEIRGRVVFSDAPNRIPAYSVALERIGLHDAQLVEVEADNTFVLRGVPSESVALTFRTEGFGGMLGYRFSQRNKSLDPREPTRLCGRVDEDVDLIVVLEPGDLPSAPSQREAGPVVIQQNGVQQVIRLRQNQIPQFQNQIQLLRRRGQNIQIVGQRNTLIDLPLQGVSAEDPALRRD